MSRRILLIRIQRGGLLRARDVSFESLDISNGLLLLIGPGIIRLVKEVNSDFEASRVCIKIPSTWEGLQACRVLQAAGITTLATTLFTMEQAILAGEVSCQYIAPYLNELRVQVDNQYVQKLRYRS